MVETLPIGLAAFAKIRPGAPPNKGLCPAVATDEDCPHILYEGTSLKTQSLSVRTSLRRMFGSIRQRSHLNSRYRSIMVPQPRPPAHRQQNRPLLTPLSLGSALLSPCRRARTTLQMHHVRDVYYHL